MFEEDFHKFWLSSTTISDVDVWQGDYSTTNWATRHALRTPLQQATVLNVIDLFHEKKRKNKNITIKDICYYV